MLTSAGVTALLFTEACISIVTVSSAILILGQVQNTVFAPNIPVGSCEIVSVIALFVVIDP